MGRPAEPDVRNWLVARFKRPASEARTWARFLTGLDWDHIRPLVRMAVAARVHPAVSMGMVAAHTDDPTVAATFAAHLEAKDKTLHQGVIPSTETASTTVPEP